MKVNGDVKKLLLDIFFEFNILIPSGPFLGNKPIKVIKYPNHPITITTVLPSIYLIGLTSDERFYDQLTYQFSHEMVHVYSDPRNNNWLIESFCESMSFIMLEKIGVKWTTNPGVMGLNWYAPNFEKYKTLTISNYLNDLEIKEVDIKDFKLSESIEKLTTPINRQINFILAYRIQIYYKKNPDVLKLIPYLHYTSIKENLGDYEFSTMTHPDINRFECKLPEYLKEVWVDFKKELR
ncbi:hypothetical protein [Aquiflexum sp.]|uniref:hypothetical protein n=1 Tax=Aquiflexum sp. TaxID=1872584 RepID=UPI0035930D65